jgi:hypothetical protein
MKDQRLSFRFGLLIGLLLLAAFSRLVPHPLNFAPIGAMALFGAAYFRSRWAAFLLPVATLWLSDIYLNNVTYAEYYTGSLLFTSDMAWVYGTMLATVLLGQWLLKRVTVVRLASAALLTSVLFFITTNFSCWPGNPIYSQDMAGLMTCFAAGIPFFKGTLLGNLFYSAVLFGAFELAQYRIPQLRAVRA